MFVASKNREAWLMCPSLNLIYGYVDRVSLHVVICFCMVMACCLWLAAQLAGAVSLLFNRNLHDILGEDFLNKLRPFKQAL